MKIFLAICCVIFLLAQTGCTGGGAVYQPRDPSMTSYWKGFDPYPEDRTAPAIDGARPPGFEHPVSEPERVRSKPWLANQ